jgi:hypothetical protein
VLILDLSRAARKNDFKPNRMRLILDYAKIFEAKYFVSNPISKLKFVAVLNGVARVVAIDELNSLSPIGEGDFSLGNGVSLALMLLELAQ